jgi:threonine dehydrogenase-like Zn-dependent dehydrogenase
MEELVERLVRWEVRPSQLITHRFPLEKAGSAYELMSSGRCGKVAVCFDEELSVVPTTTALRNHTYQK